MKITFIDDDVPAIRFTGMNCRCRPFQNEVRFTGQILKFVVRFLLKEPEQKPFSLKRELAWFAGWITFILVGMYVLLTLVGLVGLMWHPL